MSRRQKVIWTIVGAVIAFVITGALYYKVESIFNDGILPVPMESTEEGATYPESGGETMSYNDISKNNVSSLRELVDSMSESAYYFTPYVINKDTTDNMVYSPASLYIDLMALRMGSSGDTEKTLNNYLKLEDDSNVYKVAEELKIALEGDHSPVSMANAIFISKDNVKLKSSYVNAMKKALSLEVKEMDFSNVVESNKIIDDYISEKTHGMITSGAGVDKGTLVDLMNVIYFSDTWKDNYFTEEGTKERDFKTSSGETIKVPKMISTKISPEQVKEGDGFRRLDLPMKNSTVQIILPSDKSSIKEIIGNGDKLKMAMTSGKSIEAGELTVLLPKFSFNTDVSMNEPLGKVGCGELFSRELNLANMLDKGSKLLTVSEVHQKARVELDEKGVKAAAVTETMMRAVSLGNDTYTFNVDQPFIFSILDNQTGVILFIGVVNNPLK